MTEDYEKLLNQIRENLDKAKSMKIRAEARLEQLNKQRQEILRELDELGVKPEELDREIERLKKEIEELLGKAREAIPQDLN